MVRGAADTEDVVPGSPVAGVGRGAELHEAVAGRRQPCSRAGRDIGLRRDGTLPPTMQGPANPDAVAARCGVVGVRPVCDINNRVSPVLSRLRRPWRPPTALVCRVADPERARAVKVNGDAFPVGLVLVVEIVVEVKEPVLDRDSPGGRLAHDVEVDGRPRARCAKPLLDPWIPRGMRVRLGTADVE